MKKHKIFIAFLVAINSLSSMNPLYAYTERNLLQHQITQSELAQSLVLNQQWVKYPDYTDRAGWDALLKDYKHKLIQEGEEMLNYRWQVVKATDYLEFERSGDRNIMQTPYNQNKNAVTKLLWAELAEGKGRFIDQLINGVFYFCEMSSWCLSAHFYIQPSQRSLPEVEYPVIDLGTAGTASLLSWTYYFMHQQFDKVNPEISRRLYSELDARMMTPYLENDNFWWMAENYKKGQMINNWNPVCNSDALLTFMLLEKDKDRLARAVYRSLVSVDRFLNYVNADGGCEEGPGYWNISAGKALDYLEILNLATADRSNIFHLPQIKNMGEYNSRSYVGNGWVVNFADASAKAGRDPYLIYRYGRAVNSTELKQYASFVCTSKTHPSLGGDFFRSMESLSVDKELKATEAKHEVPSFSWYPETELYFKKNENAFLASKGGYNNESHNHNDVGTFSLWVKNTPIFIDAGVGTYTRQTFSSERYSIWTMQSNYHNIPMINGVPQPYGGEFKASEVKASDNKFSLNIATAYSEKAKVEKWIRSYQLKKHELVIEDDFKLKEAFGNNQVNFLTWGDVSIQKNYVTIEVQGAKAKLYFNPELFDASIETIKLTDKSLSRVWGSCIFRLCLKAKKLTEQGKYRFNVRF